MRNLPKYLNIPLLFCSNPDTIDKTDSKIILITTFFHLKHTYFFLFIRFLQAGSILKNIYAPLFFVRYNKIRFFLLDIIFLLLKCFEPLTRQIHWMIFTGNTSNELLSFQAAEFHDTYQISTSSVKLKEFKQSFL